MDADMYRITRTAPNGRPNVRYGTKHRAWAIVAQVKQDNRNSLEGVEFLRARGVKMEPRITEVTVERAPLGEFTDVTAEFLKEDQ